MFCKAVGRRWAQACVAAALLGIGGCRGSGGRQAAAQRIAILAFDNLTGASALGWVGSVTAGVAAVDCAGAPDRFVYFAGSTNDALLNRPTRYVRGTLNGEPGKWVIEGLEQDVATGRVIERWQVRGTNEAKLGDEVARRVWAGAPKLAEVNPELANALPFTDPAKAGAAMNSALMLRVKPEEAAALARQRPADARLAQLAGRHALIRRDYKQAREWLEKAIAADPNNGALHNEAAYVEFYAGDVEAALRRTAEYERLDPGSANPLDSRGEVLLLAGRFKEAEDAFVAAYGRDPQFFGSIGLKKAAVARRFSGDQAGADALFQRYLDALGKSPLAELHQAQWDYESGREPQAIERLKGTGSSFGKSQLAVWTRDAGAAKAAMESARTSVEQGQAGLATLVAGSMAVPPPGPIRALALVLRRDFAAAIPELREAVLRQTPMEASQWQVLLAWALAETGQTAEAKKLLATWPIPATTESLWESVALARFRELKKKP